MCGVERLSISSFVGLTKISHNCNRLGHFGAIIKNQARNLARGVSSLFLVPLEVLASNNIVLVLNIAVSKSHSDIDSASMDAEII